MESRTRRALLAGGLVVLLVGLGVGAGVSRPGEAPGAVVGSVLDDAATPDDPSDDRPIAWATVTVLEQGRAVGTAQTGPDGRYGVLGVPAGTYDVDARATGHRAQLRPGVVVPAGGAAQVDFRLARG